MAISPVCLISSQEKRITFTDGFSLANSKNSLKFPGFPVKILLNSFSFYKTLSFKPYERENAPTEISIMFYELELN